MFKKLTPYIGTAVTVLVVLVLVKMVKPILPSTLAQYL